MCLELHVVRRAGVVFLLKGCASSCWTCLRYEEFSL